MKYKILTGFLIVIAIAVASLAIALSYVSDCSSIESAPTGVARMKAVVYNCYGSPEVLQLKDIEKPEPKDHQVLVKVRAASVNPLDWHYMRGTPYIMRLGSGLGAPEDPSMGVDFAGIIEAVGKDVKRFKVGDEVFGGAGGSFGEYVTVSAEGGIALKPVNVSFEQAAAVPVAAITALQALRDMGDIQAGQKVLINGASGGVGTFAVQIAKSLGAEVTGVSSGRNHEMVRSIGADHMFDYKIEDYTESGNQYDLIIDMIGNHSISKNLDVLKPGGSFVIVGAEKGNWIGPLINPIKAMIYDPFVDEQLLFFVADLKQEDLEFLAGLMQAGEITSVIDKHYQLSEVPEAIAYSEEGHVRGKLVVNMED